jgi:competence protein ComEC
MEGVYLIQPFVFMKIINYRNTPFLRVVFPFGMGITLGDMIPNQSLAYETYLLIAIPIVLFIAAGIQYQHAYRWVFGLLAQCSLMCFGFLLVHKSNEQNDAEHFTKTISLSKEVLLEGMVYDAPVQGKKLKVLLRVAQCFNDSTGLYQPASGNLLLYIGGDSLANALHYGDRLAIRTKIIPVNKPVNPHAFDYRNYLHHQNIHFMSYLKWPEVKVISTDNGNWVWAQAFVYRDRLLALLQEHFTTKDEYAVASALLVGYKEDLSDEVKQAYANTGSMHALAVSGTHVGLLYVGILFLLQRLPLYGRRGRLIETILALLAIWAFTFLTGATASVLRASVMFSVYLVGKMVFRQANIWNVLGASAFGLLVYNPHFLFDAGFQLSYAAVAGMAAFYPMLYKVSPIIKNKWLDEGWRVLLVGMAAQIGTLPLSLYYFHQFPCYFWLAGWVVVLGGAIFLWAGALLIVLDWAIPILAYWLGVGLSYMLIGMNKIIFLIQDIPGSVISGVWLSLWATIFLYFIIVLFGVAVAERKKSALFAGLIGLTILLAFQAYRSVQQFDQHSICIYSINKGTLIDLFEGKERITLLDSVSAKQETFAAQGHRWAMGVQHTTHGIGDSEQNNLKYSALNNNCILNSSVASLSIVQAPIQSDSLNQIETSALLLRKGAPVTIQECLLHYKTSLFIFDQTSSRRQIEKWKMECAALGLTGYDMRERGYWEMTEH